MPVLRGIADNARARKSVAIRVDGHTMRLRPILLASILSIASPSFASDGPGTTSADVALATLKDGNARFAAGESTFPHLDQSRRCETTEGGQHPIASILSCADSRVPPELVFDAGLGDVFVIRVAGNVAAGDEIATLEYGAAHLGTSLIVVMGHGKCGAVTAVVQHADVEPNIAKLIAPIVPAVEEARSQNAGVAEPKLIALSIKANVRRAMHDVLAQSSVIRGLVEAGKVRLVGAVYDVHNGTVEWLSDAPEQTAAAKPNEAEAKPVAHHASAPVTVGHDVEKPAAHDASPVKATASHGEELLHEEKPSHEAKPAAAEHGKADAHATETHAAEEHALAAEPATKSLVDRQGLLVPAAFMAAGSALSGTIVYALKSRPTTAPTPHAADDVPAAH